MQNLHIVLLFPILDVTGWKKIPTNLHLQVVKTKMVNDKEAGALDTSKIKGWSTVTSIV